MGLVIHPEHPTAYALEGDKGYISYVDSTDETNNGNGIVYVGAVMPNKVRETKVQSFPPKEVKRCKALVTYLPLAITSPRRSMFIIGGGWNKYGFETKERWNAYLDRYAPCILNSLIVSYWYLFSSSSFKQKRLISR